MKFKKVISESSFRMNTAYFFAANSKEVHEERQQKRISQTIKAVKIITDILPFDEMLPYLLKEEGLMKYLILAYPILPSPIEMTSKCLLERFTSEKSFLKDFWSSCEFLSSLPENILSKKSSPLDRLAASIRQLVKKQSEMNGRPNLSENRGEFCTEVNDSSLIIKSLALNLLDNLLETMFNEPEKVFDYYKTAMGKLLLQFMNGSSSDTVIVKVVGMLEKLKNYQKKFDLRQRNYDDEIQILLNEKKNMANEYNEREREKERERKETKRKEKPEETQSVTGKTNKTPVSPRRKMTDPLQKAVGPQSDTQTDSDSEVDEKTAEELTKEKLIENIEKLLCQHEVPLIGKDEFMFGVLKSPDKLATFFTLFVEPDTLPLSSEEMWKTTFQAELVSSSNVLVIDEKDFSPARRSRYTSPLRSPFYQLRSYKLMQTLADPRNHKLLANVSRSFLQSFFTTLYNALTKDEISCNMNHVIRVILYCVTHEQDICVNQILHYNFLFRFLKLTDFALVPQFYISILGYDDQLKLSVENTEKILKYCHYTYFFSDLAQAILYGEDSIDEKKLETTYKPSSVRDLIKLEGEADSDNFSYAGLDSENAYKKLYEEKPGVYADIDRIKEIRSNVRGKKKTIQKGHQRAESHSVGHKRVFSINTRPNNLPSPLRAQKYPSLVEKWDTLYPDTPNWDLAEKGDSQARKGPTTLRVTRSKVVPQRLSFTRERNNLTLENPNNLSESNNISHSRSVSKQLLSPSSQLVIIKKEVSAKRISSIASSARPDSQMSQLRKGPNQETNLSNTTLTLLDEPSKTANYNSKTTKALKVLISTPSIASVSGPLTANNKTIIPYNIDASLESDATARLSKLYPADLKAYDETKFERESRNETFSVNEILENDYFSVALCEIVHALLKRVIEADGNKLRKMLQLPDIDPSEFWAAMFENNRAQVFESFYKNYLYKIKVHNLTTTNSGFEAGQIVNLLLEQMTKNQYLKEYQNEFHTYTLENFIFLQKVIIQSHAWVKKKDMKVNMQSFEVKNQLGAARLTLLKTFYLILRNDSIRKFQVLQSVLDPMWDLIISWLFQYRTNNMLLNLISGTLDLAINYGEQKTIFSLLVKLSLLPKMLKAVNELQKNDVEQKDLLGAPLISMIRRTVILIARVFTEREDLGELPKQLIGSQSWKDLSVKFIPPQLIVTEDQAEILSRSTQGGLPRDIEPIRPKVNWEILRYTTLESERTTEGEMRRTKQSSFNALVSPKESTARGSARRLPSQPLSVKSSETKEVSRVTNGSVMELNSPKSFLSSVGFVSNRNLQNVSSPKNFIIKKSNVSKPINPAEIRG